MSEADSNEATRVASRGRRIEAGVPVLVVLHSPREKCWGVLSDIDAAGIYLHGLDLNAFDDWLRAVAHDEPTVGLSDMFFPMWRVERISRDESVGDAPSLADRFQLRTGRSIDEMMSD